MLSSAVDSYLATAKGLPLFYAVGDSEYINVLTDLKQHGVVVDRVSDFCPKPDKYPDLDDIIDHFRTLDVDCRQNRHVLIGLGEYLALRGAIFTDKVLRRLKSTTLGNARVVLLLRGISAQIINLLNEDSRLIAQQRVVISADSTSMLSLTRMRYQTAQIVSDGIQGLLRAFEDGLTGNCNVKTEMEFPNSLFPVTSVNTAFAALKRMVPSLSVVENLGNEGQWDRMFQELTKQGNMDALFCKYGFDSDYEEELYQNCAGFEFRNWLFFVYLKQRADDIANPYLRYVVSKTNSADSLKENILTEIIRIPRAAPRFKTYYDARKKLIRNFPESEIAIFVNENKIDPAESIFRYTDCTRLECEEVIKWISKYGYIDEIESIYPALAQYLKAYVFDCGKQSVRLTDYFYRYRLQKVQNRIDPAFLQLVEDNAKSLFYTHLETRDAAIMKIADKNTAFLFWIDALGVEFLPYIAELARKKGLSMHVDITYSNLPSITSMNKAFYETWPGSLKAKEDELDEIKHKEKGGFNFEKCSEPIHLYTELKIIERAIDRAATELAMHTCKSFVIASDHGASRLAVIHHQEEKYDCDTKGEHSGRCCKAFDGADLSYAITENGYLVLADYGRFKKSRAANVEVHGGASMEEVVVPVISLTLKKQADLTIKVLNSDSIYADRHEGTTLQVYISDVEHIHNVSIVIGNTRYPAKAQDNTHYSFILSDIKRAKKDISAAVFDGDDLIGNVSFSIKGKVATTNDDFADLPF